MQGGYFFVKRLVHSLLGVASAPGEEFGGNLAGKGAAGPVMGCATTSPLQHGDAVSVSALKDWQLGALPAPWKKGSTTLRARFSQLEGRAHDAEAAREQTNSEDLLSG